MTNSPEYLTIPSSNQRHQSTDDNSIPCRAECRFIEKQSNVERKKIHRTNQGFKFLESSFTNKYSV